MRRRSACAAAAEIAALVMKQPRTMGELALLMVGNAARTDKVKKYVEAFRSEGLIRISEWRRHAVNSRIVAVYAWQTGVCALPDAPEPMRLSIPVFTKGTTDV